VRLASPEDSLALGLEEAEELGLDEAREDSLLIVEWPERLGEDWWRDALWLSLELTPDDARVLTAKVPAAWRDRWSQILP